jgi:hypothetical protein
MGLPLKHHCPEAFGAKLLLKLEAADSFQKHQRPLQQKGYQPFPTAPAAWRGSPKSTVRRGQQFSCR